MVIATTIIMVGREEVQTPKEENAQLLGIATTVGNQGIA